MDSNSGIYTLNAWQDNAYTIMFTQGESNVKIVKFRLVDNSGNINLTNLSEDNVFFAIKRPDGKEDLLSCIIDDPINGIISCRITSYTTAISGNVKGEIRIVYNDGVIKFYGVNLKIHEGVSDSAAEQSQPFSALTEALQKVLVMTPEGTVEIDDEITEDGENPVSSGTIYGYVNSAIEDYAGTVEQELGNKLDDENNVIRTNHIQNGAIIAEKLAQSVQNTIDRKADKTDKVFKAAHMGVLMPALRGGFPDFSTSEKTLTLRQGTQLMLEGIESSEQVKELAPNGDITIYCNSISSSAIKIYYNLQDEEFNVLEYNGVPTANDILICAIRDVSRYSSPDNGISISCAYTIDGKLFGVNIADYITNGSITESKLSPTYKQSVQTALSGKADKTNKVFKAELLGVLFPAIQNGLPNVDTANNTLTLPKGMSLLLVSTSGSSQTKALSPDDDVVIPYPSTSSAVKIYYDLANEQFNTYTYDGVPSQNDVLICTIRDTSVYGISNNSMSISCPFTIDGKLFGVNLADYIANNSITEAQLSTAYKLSVQNSIDKINAYVSGINSNVNSLKKISLFNLIKSATFEKGTLNNGVEAVSSTRIRSAFINISDVRSLQVSANSGYKYNLHFYDSNGTFVSSSFGNIYWHWVDWQTESYFIPILPAVKYVRIVISDTSNSENITLNDSSKIKVLADYSLYREFENVTNYCGKLQESIVSHNNWVNAVSDGGSGLDYSSTRICSGLIELPKSGIININTATGYEASYIVYNENMTRIKVTEYSTSCTAEIGNNYKWIVVFVKADSGSNVDISSSEGSNCSISYIPIDNVQFVENVATSAATNAVTNAENIQRVENIVSNYEKVQHVDNIIPNPCTDIGWGYGTLWEDVESDSSTRIRSNFILVGKGTRVKCNPNYKHLVFKYDHRKKWISNDTIYSSNEKVIDEECFIRIVMAKADYSAISENEISTIANTEIIIRQLPQSIVENASDFSCRIPSYYQPQLKAAIDSALNNIIDAGNNGESFIFFSDPHWEGNAKWSPALIKEITKQTNINTIICGGDLIEGGNKAAMVKAMNNLITRFKGAGKLYVAYGNHDGNTIGSPSEGDHLSKGETYALAQKQSDFDVHYGELCYYFFDNPTTKTRFIVLDTGLERTELDNAQRTWFENALSNMPSDYHALIFAHIIYMSGTWYVGVSPDVFTRTDFMNDICAICDRFNSAENGKTVEAIFGGHTHLDLDPNLDPPDPNDPDHVNKFKSAGGIPIIIIDCDAMTTASADGQGNRDAVRGTITEQCFDIVTIDYTARIIYCVRIGRGSDRTISYQRGLES